MEKLACKNCGHQNETERVYCHNCGNKLDRSELPKASSPEDRRRKARKQMRKGQTAAMIKNRIFKPLMAVLLWSVLVAFFLLMIQTPRDLPLPPDHTVNAPSIAFDLADALSVPQPRQLAYSQEQVNGYLARTLRSKKEPAWAKYSKFKGVSVDFDPDLVTVYMTQTVLNHPLAIGTRHELAVKENELITTNRGGYIGRLRIPPLLMQYVDKLFFKIWEAFEQERDKLARLQSITIGDGRIQLATPGT